MANSFKNYIQKSVGTSPTTLHTGPGGTQSTIIGMSIANVITSPIDVSVGLTTGATSVWLVKDATIAPGGSLIPIGGDQKVVLEAADVIFANSSVAGSADVIVSVLEIS